MSRAVMQQALEALERGETKLRWAAITALRAALAESEQEPVAWELRMGKTDRVLMEITNNPKRAQDWRASLCEVVPLYYAPTPRKPLTDEEIGKIAGDCLDAWSCARAIERAHGIGEQT